MKKYKTSWTYVSRGIAYSETFNNFDEAMQHLLKAMIAYDNITNVSIHKYDSESDDSSSCICSFRTIK